jgi:hypothetical protein
VAVLVLWGGVGRGAERTSVDPVEPDVRVAVEADWAAQERRAGREPGSPAAITAALSRSRQLLDRLGPLLDPATIESAEQAWLTLSAAVEDLEALSPHGREALYLRLRWAARDWALLNPLWAQRPILFLQRKRFICQMLHEYIGYYYNYGNLAGGGVYVLERPGYSFAKRDLVAGRLPRGAFATPALSYDGRTAYFAFSEVRDTPRAHRVGHTWHILPPADQVPPEFNYYTPQRAVFQLYAVDADGGELRRLTAGRDDDFGPCPLPDGDLIFMSSRRGGFCRCDNPFEPIPTHTLHRLDMRTGAVRTLSWHETNEWHPALLSDGRIVYCRWDYVDRSAAHYHGLWVSNPDGSNPSILFGNYTQDISACYQPSAVPGSRKIVFVAGAHHANVGGSLVLFDPARARLDGETGEDRFESLERLTPEVCFAETSEGWPGSFFHSPWPLSEDFYLVAFSFDPLPGMGSGVLQDSETGIYYFDRFGNLELLLREAGVCSVAPIPLGPRPAPPTIPSTDVPTGAETGEFVLADAHWSLLPSPTDRPIRELRIYQVLPKETTHIANQPRIGLANAESARMLLGSVPVEADGSAYFRAPANRPLYFQSVDDAGRAVQSMRSVTYLQPGERRGCVGCHETPGSAPPTRALLATQRPPSDIRPGPPGTRPLSYPLLVQDVLDRHCVRCHDDGGGETAAPVLTGDVTGPFTRSYENLRPYVRWYEWGDASITQVVTRPGRGGADESPLVEVLHDANHHGQVQLPDDDLRRIYLWLDANVPFYGTYREPDRRRQLEGQVVGPPGLQ